MLVEMPGNASATHLSLIHPDVESLRSRHLPQHLHGTLRQSPHLGDFGVVKIGVVRDMAVGTHEEVARVVGIKIHHDVRRLPSGDHEPLALGQSRRAAEGALVARTVMGGSTLAPEVGLAVRGP